MDLGMLGGMMGMMPPGVQELVDSLPDPGVMDRVATFLGSGDSQWSDSAIQTEERDKVAGFLSLLAQLIKQQGLFEQAEVGQTEQLKLQCPVCHLEFAVDNALSYRRRVQEGYLCACANGHDVTVIGSGRLGELTPDEEFVNDSGDATVRVIYPKDYQSESTNDNTGN